ncbi:hypothetical protein COLO4_20245 [Corchorus olitorius]|uniref:Uncharacterized protein n=1 Tax=Corchorus olitorius TaxID=93759 RepID=A0A1R3J0V7_9ROSI|nr:hypothetical protein COLO4_20245 [Corchorus olitorius]
MAFIPTPNVEKSNRKVRGKQPPEAAQGIE